MPLLVHFRRHLRVTDHSNMGGRGDCNTTFICTATPRGWVPDPQNPHGDYSIF